MKRYLSILFAFTLLFGCKEELSKRKILLVVAHPDDDTAIGPVLAKLSKSDDIYQWIITDGRYGTRVKEILEDSLVVIRKQESICSCEKLGINPPEFFNFRDGLGIRQGMHEYFNTTRVIKKVLKENIENLKPDIIITFGPDGDTGHPDHRIVGNLITELILQEKWHDQFPVYFLGWTKEQSENFEIDQLGYIDKDYFNVEIPYSEEDEQRYFEAIRCYQSQYSKSELNDWINTEQLDTTNTMYFRKFEVAKGKKGDFPH